MHSVDPQAGNQSVSCMIKIQRSNIRIEKVAHSNWVHLDRQRRTAATIITTTITIIIIIIIIIKNNNSVERSSFNTISL